LKARWLTPFALVLTSSAAAVAQEPKTLEPVVVTATKVATPQERLGAAVSVVTGEDLRSQNQFRIEEALRSLPGVEVERQGSFGKVTTVTIRGANASQVQVLIDGMRVKSPTLGLFDFSDVSLDAIERIEVVRGPQSTLHGADAIGGVINIITKQGAGPPSGTALFEGGSWQTFREQGATSGAIGRVDYSLSGSRLDSRGQERTFNNDDSDQTAFAGQFGVTLPWDARLAFTGRYSKANTDTPINLFLSTRDPDSQQQTEFYLYSLRYEQKLFPWWTVSARIGQMWNNQGFQNGPLPPGDFAFTSQTDTRRREIEALSTWRMGSWNELTLGFEHEEEWGRIVHTLRADSTTVSGFLQDTLTLFDRLIVGAGFRYDDNDVFGSAKTPRVSVAFLIPETGTKLRTAYGEGFRAPSFDELFFPDQTGGLCPPFGNRSLRPERSRSWEAGVDQKLWENRVRLGATWFLNKFRDLIAVVGVPPTPAGEGSGFICQSEANVGRARSTGVEAYSEIEPLDWLLFRANYTFTDTEDEATGQDLPRFARHRVNAGVTVTPIPRLSMFVEAHVVSRQFEATLDRHNPGYYRIDAGGTFRLIERAGPLSALEFTLRIQNLTDNRYEEVAGFPALGFTALAGLRAQFR
jgi:vitamin B12 transporter